MRVRGEDGAGGVTLWQGLDGPVEFSAGPFFTQEIDQTFAQSLEQI